LATFTVALGKAEAGVRVRVGVAVELGVVVSVGEVVKVNMGVSVEVNEAVAVNEDVDVSTAGEVSDGLDGFVISIGLPVGEALARINGVAVGRLHERSRQKVRRMTRIFQGVGFRESGDPGIWRMVSVNRLSVARQCYISEGENKTSPRRPQRDTKERRNGVSVVRLSALCGKKS
jgi:hypothetical protein